MTMQLSSAAQAVLTAASVAKDHARCPIAAALRAAADAVAISPYTMEHAKFWSELHDIAAELEGASS